MSSTIQKFEVEAYSCRPFVVIDPDVILPCSDRISSPVTSQSDLISRQILKWIEPQTRYLSSARRVSFVIIDKIPGTHKSMDDLLSVKTGSGVGTTNSAGVKKRRAPEPNSTLSGPASLQESITPGMIVRSRSRASRAHSVRLIRRIEEPEH